MGAQAAGVVNGAAPRVSLMSFFINKIMLNLLIWTIAYIFTARAPKGWVPEIDLLHFLDWRALLVFASAAAIVVLLAFLIAKAGAMNLIAAAREEVSTALVNVCSILLVVSIPAFNLVYLLLALFGYLVAWRLP